MIKRYLIILTAMFVGVFQAKAWGSLEHSVIAYVAQEYLTENAAKNLRYYLDQPIYEYSDWMDFKPVVRRPGFDIPKNGHSTVVGTDGTIPEITPVENGKGKGSCYKYLKDIVYTLENHRTLPDSLVIYHLRCFIHMMGDFHCPVHVHFFDLPTDGGSLPSSIYKTSKATTPVSFKGKETDLHTVLDGSLRHIHGDWTFEQWKEELDTFNEEQRNAVVAGDFKTYLIGNCEVSREIYDNATPDMVIDDAYFTGRMRDLLYQQIRYSIYRLAKVLNDCFDYEN